MPLDKLTRSQMAQVLFNLEGKKSVNYALTFGDMNGTEWYAEAVRWAASEQIVNGYDNGNFGPNDPITREQLVTVLYRYAQYKGLDTATTEENLTSFADAAQVSGYAVSAMNWAVGAGVINGTDSGLAPKATIRLRRVRHELGSGRRRDQRHGQRPGPQGHRHPRRSGPDPDELRPEVLI